MLTKAEAVKFINSHQNTSCMDLFVEQCIETDKSLQNLSRDTLNALCRIIAGAVNLFLFINNQYRLDSLNARFSDKSDEKCRLSKLELYALCILRCQALLEEKKDVDVSFFYSLKKVEELLEFLG